jgi:hypothetical protein
MGCCECGNKRLDSIKGEEFLVCLSVLFACQEGPCPMELAY